MSSSISNLGKLVWFLQSEATAFLRINSTEYFGEMPFVNDFIYVLEDCRDMASRTSTYNMEFTLDYVKYCLYLSKSCHVERTLLYTIGVGSVGLSLILYPMVGGERCDRFLHLMAPGSLCALQKCDLGAV